MMPSSISIVVPVYSGADYLAKLVEEASLLRKKLASEGMPFLIRELIFVDDASKDNSAQVLQEIAAKESWITVLTLSRNFGQHPATCAGILHTSGDWVVTMDEDLQHPPSRIPDLLSKAVLTHSDIVYGNPVSRVHESIFRDFSSRNFKGVIERLTGNETIRKVNSFRLIRGNIARAASSVAGHDTYFDVVLTWFSKRIETLPMHLVDARFVEHGKSGYSLKSLLSHARRLAFSSQIKLLRAGALLGFALLVFTFLAALVLVFLKVFATGTIISPGWTSLMLAICFFSGVTMLLTGIALEYISVLVLRAHGKPLYFTVDRQADQVLIDYFGSND